MHMLKRVTVTPPKHRSLLSRQRFQFAAALIVGSLLPWGLRGTILPGEMAEAAAVNALLGNVFAITIAFWARLSVETYPGIRRSYVILPTALASHGIVITALLLARLPYDRLSLTLGFLLHVLVLYSLYIYTERRIKKRFAMVPFGGVDRLLEIPGIDWMMLKRPQLHDAGKCDAIVADFSADLPDEWESFLADAALAGRLVYQHKQLAESLTGRVELKQLSENSFGSLLPIRGYFYLKTVLDFAGAIVVLPFVLPVMVAIAIAIKVDSRGPAIFRQRRVGHAGRVFYVYKFRTMRTIETGADRLASVTRDGDERVTAVGRVIRRLRLDELPQILNIMKLEMSWIGPRPEAVALSNWYTQELPFYRYRHVVKPGISGWAQVNQGHVAEVAEVHRKLQYDFYYIKYFSPWLDVLIVLRTVKTMLTGFGSR